MLQIKQIPLSFILTLVFAVVTIIYLRAINTRITGFEGTSKESNDELETRLNSKFVTVKNAIIDQQGNIESQVNKKIEEIKSANGETRSAADKIQEMLKDLERKYLRLEENVNFCYQNVPFDQKKETLCCKDSGVDKDTTSALEKLFMLSADSLKRKTSSIAPLEVKEKALFNAFFVEFKKSNPSHSLWLERCLGWKGVLLVPNPSRLKNLAQERRNSLLLPFDVCSSGDVMSKKGLLGSNSQYEIPCKKLSDIFHMYGIANIEFLSLDVTGKAEILDTIDFDKVEITCILLNFVSEASVQNQEHYARQLKEKKYKLASKISESKQLFVME